VTPERERTEMEKRVEITTVSDSSRRTGQEIDDPHAVGGVATDGGAAIGSGEAIEVRDPKAPIPRRDLRRQLTGQTSYKNSTGDKLDSKVWGAE